MKIMFVCTGNTCRSPMAEALYRRAAIKAGRHDQVISRGTLTDSEGDNILDPDSLSLKTMRKYYALDISQHKPKPISAEDVVWADLILTMKSDHIDTIKRIPGERLDLNLDKKLHTFGGYLGLPDLSVEDPMMKGTLEAYLKCAKKLDSWASMLVDKLNAQSKS